MKEFKDVYAWTYKDLKRIPPKLAQHKIELDITIPLAYQTKYKLNPNYVITIKQDIDKLLVIGFIQSVKEATWLSPIVKPNNNGKLGIYIDFKKLIIATKKDPYPLPFTNEILNTIARYEAYSLNGYLGYHQISITLKDGYKIAFVTDLGAFAWKVMSFGIKIDLQHIKELLPKHLKTIWTIL